LRRSPIALRAPATSSRAANTVARLRRVRPGAVALPGLASLYLSLLVLIPIAALLTHAFTGGLGSTWAAITQPETLASIKLVLVVSLIVVVVNSVVGTAIAWQLVRDRFILNRVISAIVDLPFALPTIVAGVVLLSLYGPASPFGINVAFQRWSLVLALSFVTLPFAVRSVQPVLEALDAETEEAAASLGASPFTTFTRIILPSLAPALATGAGLAFARAIGEYGSVSLISGNVPFRTEVASVRIYGLIESDDLSAAAATSLALFIVTLLVLAIFSIIRRRFALREG
jgi:sulfate/thiosulfate transport system permease protein